MSKTISATNLRVHVRRVLDEVHYTETDYIVEKFVQPIGAIISLSDYELLQAARQQSATTPTEGPSIQTTS
jgi:prevent-host-death family protein